VNAILVPGFSVLVCSSSVADNMQVLNVLCIEGKTAFSWQCGRDGVSFCQWRTTGDFPVCHANV